MGASDMYLAKVWEKYYRKGMNLERGSWELVSMCGETRCSAVQKIVVGMCVCYRFLHRTLQYTEKLTHRLTQILAPTISSLK